MYGYRFRLAVLREIPKHKHAAAARPIGHPDYELEPRTRSVVELLGTVLKAMVQREQTRCVDFIRGYSRNARNGTSAAERRVDLSRPWRPRQHLKHQRATVSTTAKLIGLYGQEDIYIFIRHWACVRPRTHYSSIRHLPSGTRQRVNMELLLDEA